jgi:hypothetical protein
VFENRVLRRIFESQRDKNTGEWIYYEDEIKEDETGGTCGTHEEMRNKLQNLG